MANELIETVKRELGSADSIPRLPNDPPQSSLNLFNYADIAKNLPDTKKPNYDVAIFGMEEDIRRVKALLLSLKFVGQDLQQTSWREPKTGLVVNIYTEKDRMLKPY